MEYEEIKLEIHSLGNDWFEAQALALPAAEGHRLAEARTKFHLPIAEGLLDELEARMKQVVDLAEGLEPKEPGFIEKLASFLSDDPEMPSPRALGQKLYGAVFQGPLHEIYQKYVVDGFAAPGTRGLRLRLRFLVSDEEAEYLARLPWELLCDPQSGELFGRNPRTPIVRELTPVEPRPSLTVDGPLKVLMVGAAARTVDKQKIEVEVKKIEAALGIFGDRVPIELYLLTRPTPDGLRDALASQDFHVLHFKGHGCYDEATRMGGLKFEDESGTQEVQVDGEDFAAMLKLSPELRLVFLNSCVSARHGGYTGRRFSFGAASGILAQPRAPAVIAHQYSISDFASILLAQRFYSRLAELDPADAAIAECRLHLSIQTQEWVTPVLFMSSDNGRLLPKSAKRVSPLVKRLVPGRGRPAEEPVRLRVVSFQPSKDDDGNEQSIIWGEEGENTPLLDLTRHFRRESRDGRLIQDRAWWQEKIFPELKDFLRQHTPMRGTVILDLAAHASIAFAAGWILEAKSGLEIRVCQRSQKATGKPLDWSPDEGPGTEEAPWLDKPDRDLREGAPDVAVALSLSNAGVDKHAEAYIERADLPVGRLIDAVVAPEPGQRSIQGGAHALRLAQTLINRLRIRKPHERDGKLHLFASAPNAFLVYLGQLAHSLGTVVMYEYAHKMKHNFGRYQRSIELPPPDKRHEIPEDW